MPFCYFPYINLYLEVSFAPKAVQVQGSSWPYSRGLPCNGVLHLMPFCYFPYIHVQQESTVRPVDTVSSTCKTLHSVNPSLHATVTVT